ncbi:thiamine diphosphokinase [Promethearchaeum syntrophicum]|uniref:Thiamine diphosphokinase n=1 Tax=Promethearchaeum syntrophicum TaxID=2594042 RepID=A0A5B9DH49_9ARCH|nr:thiamine diphosphokinase [Candidatus Prometheoarchaeum syntrophicum]QEE18036.1 Thiamin pyrophosphokinase, catalytic domain [Candidatus Prometheoarchaeum syntrophicum]
MKSYPRAFLISGSPEINYEYLKFVKENIIDVRKDTIYAIDKGLEICDKLKIPISKIIGDFDSVEPDILKKYSNDKILRFKSDKDKSDTELAIDFALKRKFQEMIILNSSGARLDHFLFNALLLFKKPIFIKILTPNGVLWALESDSESIIELKPNTIFSLIPFSKCTGVSITGSNYDLKNKTVELSSTLTLSNVANGSIKVKFKSGLLLFYAKDCTFLI